MLQCGLQLSGTRYSTLQLELKKLIHVITTIWRMCGSLFKLMNTISMFCVRQLIPTHAQNSYSSILTSSRLWMRVVRASNSCCFCSSSCWTSLCCICKKNIHCSDTIGTFLNIFFFREYCYKCMLNTCTVNTHQLQWIVDILQLSILCFLIRRLHNKNKIE